MLHNSTRTLFDYSVVKAQGLIRQLPSKLYPQWNQFVGVFECCRKAPHLLLRAALARMVLASGTAIMIVPRQSRR